jgi:hypothetical protein
VDVHLPLPHLLDGHDLLQVAADLFQGHLIPWLQYQPDWKGWRSLGLSPDSIGIESSPREEFLKRFQNSAISSLARRRWQWGSGRWRRTG